MGIVKKQRKKRVFHKKRWDKATIEEEKLLVQDYALKNKKEIRKFELYLRKIKTQAKEFNKHSVTGLPQEAYDFINRLKNMGFLKIEDAGLDDVLGISLRDILDRRLGALVYKHKLARTPKQARQVIAHGHVTLDTQKVNSANILVDVNLEKTISYNEKSALFNENHPLRKEEFEEIIEESEEIKNSPKKAPQEDAVDVDEKEQKLNEEELDEVKKE